MPGSHRSQNNEIASQIITLPISYLNYLSHKNVNINTDWEDDNNILVTKKLCLFSGIKMEVLTQERIQISIDKEALPSYCQSLPIQTIILNALQVLELISKLPADAIEPESQQEMLMSIQNALQKCLSVKHYADRRVIVGLIIVTLAQSLFVVSALALYSIALFAPIFPPILFVAMALIIAGTALGASIAFSAENIRDVVRAASALKQAKTVCNELVDEVEKANLKIAHLTRRVSGDGEQNSFIPAVNQPSGNKLSAVSTSTLWQPAAPANSPIIDSEQENTSTAALKPS